MENWVKKSIFLKKKVSKVERMDFWKFEWRLEMTFVMHCERSELRLQNPNLQILQFCKQFRCPKLEVRNIKYKNVLSRLLQKQIVSMWFLSMMQTFTAPLILSCPDVTMLCQPINLIFSILFPLHRKTFASCLKIQYYYTLFEIFIFCPKIQLWFPEKIVNFLVEKLVKMLWFWTF